MKRLRHIHGGLQVMNGGTVILVVHTDHGIGRFLGTEAVESRGFSTECLVLLYADGEKLFVPVEDFHLVQKYLGGESAPLAKLGGTAWQKAKEKARAGIMAIAGELVQLYALRELSSGFSFPALSQRGLGMPSKAPQCGSKGASIVIDSVAQRQHTICARTSASSFPATRGSP